MSDFYEVLIGATKKVTWVSSGAAPSAIGAALRDRNDTLVTSMAAVSSGNGFYYALLPHPTTPGWYVNEWIASIGVNTYVDRQFCRVKTMEAD